MQLRDLILMTLLVTGLVGCAGVQPGASRYAHLSAKELLAAGQLDSDKGNYREAAQKLEAIDALYPFAPEVRQAQLELMYAYYKQGDDGALSALATAKRFLSIYPSDRHADYVYYLMGLVNFEQNKFTVRRLLSRRIELLDLDTFKDAFVNFSWLVTHYPKSKYLNNAIGCMYYIRDLLAMRELITAEFYLERKSYVAAINRANELIKAFPTSSSTKKALEILVAAYRALGLPLHTAQAETLLALNA